MKIVLPISAHDAHLAERFTDVLKHFGRLENHSIAISPAQSQMALAEKMANELSGLTQDVQILPIAFEGDGRWPQSPNLQWVLTIDALHKLGNQDCIFWMELDCTPVVPNWADLIENVWRSGRKAFAGKIVPCPKRNEAGAIIVEPDDTMMMGCGVYPHNIMQIKQVDVYLRGFISGTNPQAWDVYLRGWMRTLGWTPTDLIGDRWNTMNYRMENGTLVCDAGPTKFKARDHSREDITGAAVVHGCKDGSLAQLVLEQAYTPSALHSRPSRAGAFIIPPNAPQTLQPQPPSIPAAAPMQDLTPIIERLENVIQRGESLISQLSGMVERSTVGIVTMDELITALSMAAQAEGLDVPGMVQGSKEAPPEMNGSRQNGHAPDIAHVRGVLNAHDGRKVHVTALAKEIGMERPALEALITAEDSGITMNRGWCGLQT